MSRTEIVGKYEHYTTRGTPFRGTRCLDAVQTTGIEECEEGGSRHRIGYRATAFQNLLT